MLLLGFGLGMVMQVLVLAAQNSVEYRFLGVATSGSTLFRQVGGSIGVAAFGAIFTNQLATELAKVPADRCAYSRQRQPSGRQGPPGRVAHGGGERLRGSAPAGVPGGHRDTVIAFALTFLLQEIPLRSGSDPTPPDTKVAEPEPLTTT